ncbi:MAG: carbohydrate kinase family protein [Clostridia bacterium]|nr:carbohydrate kinase family protein [Clostridia bacterium]
MQKWDVFVMGDINIDLVVPGVETLPPMGSEMVIPAMPTFVGGGAALFAMGTAKLGMKTVFQGRIGRDPYGAFIRQEIRRVGVDDTLLHDDERPTGISICFTGPRDRCFVTCAGTNDGLSLDELNLDEVRNARHIHLTGYQGAANHDEYKRTLINIREMGNITVSMDVGWDPTGEWPEAICELFPLIDIVLMNETECLHYMRRETVHTCAARIAESAGMAVIKLGSRGSLACRSGRILEVPAFRVEAVDTTGAGDSFNAGFISAYLRGENTEICLMTGNACGALSVTAMGGNTAFPAAEQLEQFLAAHGKRN